MDKCYNINNYLQKYLSNTEAKELKIVDIFSNCSWDGKKYIVSENIFTCEGATTLSPSYKKVFSQINKEDLILVIDFKLTNEYLNILYTNHKNLICLSKQMKEVFKNIRGIYE